MRRLEARSRTWLLMGLIAVTQATSAVEPAEDPPSAAAAFARCDKLHPQAGDDRAGCQRAALTARTRQTAARRLTAISRAFRERVAEHRPPVILALSPNGRPAHWCERFFVDLLALRNLEVVDDMGATTPKWQLSADAESRPVLDPGYREWQHDGRRLPDGYVTVRWDGHIHTVLLRTLCFPVGGQTSCTPLPYGNLHVFDGETPTACDLAFISAPYWENWKDKLTPLSLRGAASRR